MKSVSRPAELLRSSLMKEGEKERKRDERKRDKKVKNESGRKERKEKKEEKRKKRKKERKKGRKKERKDRKKEKKRKKGRKSILQQSENSSRKYFQSESPKNISLKENTCAAAALFTKKNRILTAK